VVRSVETADERSCGSFSLLGTARLTVFH
jgi:hypothetical protein